jgi:hypothetical protein
MSPTAQLGREILESDTTSSPETLARLCDAPQELRVMLQSIVEPVVLALEADKHASWFPMSRDEDFLGLRQAQESREIVLHLSQGCLAYWASRARRATARLRLS